LTSRSQVSCWFWRTGKLEKDGDIRSKPLAGPYRRLRPKDTSENNIMETGENKEKHIRLHIERSAEWAKIPNLKDNIPILIVF